MKTLISFVLLLTLTPLAHADLTEDEIATWIKPLLGKHALQGGEGCAELVIKTEQGTTFAFDVTTVSTPVFGQVISPPSPNHECSLSWDKSTLKCKQENISGGGGVIVTLSRIEVTQNNGRLESVKAWRKKGGFFNPATHVSKGEVLLDCSN